MIVTGPSQTDRISASGPNSLITCRQAPQGAVGSGVGVKTSDRSDHQRPLGFSNRLKDRVALGADRQAIRGILDVAAGKDLAAVGQHGRADLEAAVGTIGVRRGRAAAAISCSRTSSSISMAVPDRHR